MNPPSFDALMQELAGVVAGRRLDAALAAQLNAGHGAGLPLYRRVRAACIEGVADGSLCAREGGGIRYGRACKPSPELHGFSVDVVDMRQPVVSTVIWIALVPLGTVAVTGLTFDAEVRVSSLMT